MKNCFVFSIVILLIIAYSFRRPYRISSEIRDLHSYKVNKIDSLNNYYIVYVERNDSLFKVVSKKQVNGMCNSIKTKHFYSFKLNLIQLNINGSKTPIVNNLDIQCYQFDQQTKICNEKGVYGLFVTEDLKGLCYIGK